MRKRCKRKVWGLLDPIAHAVSGAGITDTASLDKLRLRELAAIESFRIGRAGKQEWMDLADMLNISETLSRDGVGPEALEPCERAQQALADAHARFFGKPGALVLTGPELQSLRDAYEYHDLQRASIARSQYEQAIKKTGNRLRSGHGVKVCVADDRTNEASASSASTA
jgi:hypothetical protein